jgi:uridine kinase
MKPVMVGIAGGSGSGKTTLARGLAVLTERHGSRIISQDHYYLGVPEGTHADLYNFDDPAALDLDLLAQHLQMLKRGRGIHMPQYNFSSHRRQVQAEWVVPAPLIIAEGLFLYTSAPLRESFDLRFFVDVPAEERLRRRIARDVAERGRAEEDVVRQFEGQVEPMYQRCILPTKHYADHVLSLPHPDESLYCKKIVAMWGVIERSLRQRSELEQSGGNDKAV